MNIDKSISIKCEGSSYIELDQMNKFQGNLKSIDKQHLTDLKQSLVKHGLPFPFSVWKDKKDKYWIIDGTHRYIALQALKSDGFFIPPLPMITIVASSKKEAAQFVLISNSKYSVMTQESLSDFMINEELSLPDLEFLDLPDLDMSAFALEDDENDETNNESENVYTDKIESPIYTPKGTKPQITELYDKSKTDNLISEIESSSLSKDEKEFLKLAAQRHITFNYQNIAEYYSHSEKPTQDLMENSALVIIDYKKAIELGFVKLTKDLAEAYNDDQE